MPLLGRSALLAFFASVAITGVAHAGLFSTTLSDANAAGLKRIAVVSLLGDTVHGRLIGLTVFQNKSFDAALPEWALDARLGALLKARMEQSGRLAGAVIEPLSVLAPEELRRRDRLMPVDSDRVLALAREQGFDAVLAVLPQEATGVPWAAAGAGIVRHKLPAMDRIEVCVAAAIRLLRVADGRQLGYAQAPPCNAHAPSVLWRDGWAAYADDEQRAALAAITSEAERVVSEELATVGFRPAP